MAEHALTYDYHVGKCKSVGCGRGSDIKLDGEWLCTICLTGMVSTIKIVIVDAADLLAKTADPDDLSIAIEVAWDD